MVDCALPPPRPSSQYASDPTGCPGTAHSHHRRAGRSRRRLAECRGGESIANEFQGKPGNEERCQKDRQEPLTCASEGDGIALGDIEGLGAARHPAIADLEGVTPGL